MKRTVSLPSCFVLWPAALVILSGAAIANAAETRGAFAAAMNSIVADQLQGHVNVLADDAMAGREAGTSGGRAAAEYLVERLQELGLEGAGTDNSFYQRFGAGYRNVLARLPGRDPELSSEIVVLCAHYDHLGRGSRKSSLGRVGMIHNGADDNASGTSAIVELAEAFSFLPEPPRRTVLFAFWDAEEEGLLGSKHWAANPTASRDRIVAVVNIDMIGRLRDDQLTLFGSRTAHRYRRLVSLNNAQSDLRIDFSWDMTGNADHYPFYQRSIPVLFAHTGVHDQYHRERDDADLIDSQGMTRVVRLLFGVSYDLAEDEECPTFRTACRRESPPRSIVVTKGVGAVPQRLGVAWDPQKVDDRGIELTSVAPGSAADAAGIRPGDRVVELAGHVIHSGEDLAGAVFSAVNPVRVVIKPRQVDESRELIVQLEGDPLRLGITWRLDKAEPGTVILKQVFPGSAAARAGLRTGDRIYRVAGRDFDDDEQFAEWVTTFPGPLEFLVERDGRLTTIVVRFDEETVERAA
jgi:peptidase M28-like protein/PDZ domain-containing protein